MSITFEGKSFCFTGNLHHLKRTNAEREVRSRKGLTQKVVNQSLDYLVIGMIPSPSWKYGDYGSKIKEARSIIGNKNSKLILISEHDFMDALENTPAVSDGNIKSKILSIRYKSLVRENKFDKQAIEAILYRLSDIDGFHISATLEEPYIYAHVFDISASIANLDDYYYLTIRMIKEFPMEINCQAIVDDITIGFEKINGLDGEMSFIERKEGTASYSSLLHTIPQSLNLSIIKN